MSLLRSTAIDAINTDPIIMAIGQMQIAPWVLRTTAIDAINSDPIEMVIGQMQIAPWVLRSTATKAINSDPIKMEIGQMPVPLQPRLSTQIPSKWRLVKMPVLCISHRDQKPRNQCILAAGRKISDASEERTEILWIFYSIVMPLIFRWKIIFIVSYQTMKYKFNYTPLVKFHNFNAYKEYGKLFFCALSSFEESRTPSVPILFRTAGIQTYS